MHAVGAVWDVAVVAALACWFVLTVVQQFDPPWWVRRRHRDAWNLVPRWTFFAPNPAGQDAHVVVRVRRDGQWSGWTALTPAPPDRRITWCWHPARILRKAAIDLVNGLRTSGRDVADVPAALVLTGPYLALVAWAAAQPGVEPGDDVQFAVVTGRGFGDDEVIELEQVSQPHAAAAPAARSLR